MWTKTQNLCVFTVVLTVTAEAIALTTKCCHHHCYWTSLCHVRNVVAGSFRERKTLTKETLALLCFNTIHKHKQDVIDKWYIMWFQLQLKSSFSSNGSGIKLFFHLFNYLQSDYFKYEWLGTYIMWAMPLRDKCQLFVIKYPDSPVQVFSVVILKVGKIYHKNTHIMHNSFKDYQTNIQCFNHWDIEKCLYCTCLLIKVSL